MTSVKVFLVLIFLVLPIMLWMYVESSFDRMLSISFLDVGQGDSIFIESPTGVQVLIDSGASKGFLRELSNSMRWNDKSIDLVIATHPDKDHVGGFPELLRRYTVSYFVDPGAKNESGVANTLEKLLTEKKIPRILGRRGMVFDIGGGASLSVLFPDRDVSGIPSNDGSLVLRLTHGEVDVLLLGDAPKKTETYLVRKDGLLLKSEVLKIGHHGSDTSTSALFLETVRPQFSIVSAGVNNQFGHPHRTVTMFLDKFKSVILSTQNNGTIRFYSNGETISQ